MQTYVNALSACLVGAFDPSQQDLDTLMRDVHKLLSSVAKYNERLHRTFYGCRDLELHKGKDPGSGQGPDPEQLQRAVVSLLTLWAAVAADPPAL